MLAACALAALACQFRPELLQPTTYRSPSGEWSLFVDPSSKHGRGPARVVVSHDGVTAWERELPVTFWSAAIDDAGRVAGYGFTDGPRSWRGEMHVLVLSRTGEVLRDDEHAMKGSAGPDGPSNPQVRGAFLQPELQRYVVRVVDDIDSPRNEAWRAYRLATGEVEVAHPKELLARNELLRETFDARPVPGTPLALAQWSWLDFPGERAGFRFVLCDARFREVWSSEQSRALRQTWQGPGILDDPGERRRFALRFFAREERVEYEVSEDASAPTGWTVREVDRRPAALPPADEQVVPPPLPELELALRSSILLAANAPPPQRPVRDVLAFDVDGAGRARFVRAESDADVVSLVSLDERGEVLREQRIEPLDPEREGPRTWFALADGDWLCTLARRSRDEAVRAWRVADTTGAAALLEGLAASSSDHLEATADGGFVAFDRRASVLRCHAASGAVRWTKPVVQGAERPDELRIPLDLALAPDGGVALLGWDSIQLLDAGGNYLRSIDLVGSPLEHEGDADGLVVEASGTFLVHEALEDAWHRLSAEGEELARIQLRRADGSRDVGEPEVVRRAGDGALWTTDGRELFSVDSTGVAHARFGAAADPFVLAEPAAIFFDGRGRVAVVDGRTRVVHLFEASGELAFRCAPAPTDFAPQEEIDRVKSGPDGRIYVHVEHSERWLEFDARGERIGWSACEGEDLAFGPAGARWCGGGSVWTDARVQRVEPDGSKGPRIDRRPDGEFLETISGIACAPDGSLVLFEQARPIAVGIYAADGAPKRRIPISPASRPWPCHVSVGQEWILASGASPSALLVSIPDGRAVQVHVEPSEGDDARYALTLSPDETELWCATTKPLALRRYALPR